ncbi:hypothetical protein SCP_0403230 [Sparassis crispa]|uniref:RlpA-like protein double-psi beta-barrel domain-containing protein n=1 Tax=Sparassis crispa TaxID=139825 RepID=A0A401GIE6_9APHY|nr:hypothetical protein SCP_0403230 [Sparassis crispa]GBE81947.1 hypothetical protein SCP_0403230 [Sparassis crispa]
MFHLFSVVFIALAAAFSVVGVAIPARDFAVRSTSAKNYIEERYSALNCGNKQRTSFFTACCGRWPANETLEDLPSGCFLESSSVSSAGPSGTQDLYNQCHCDDDPSSAPVPIPSASTSVVPPPVSALSSPVLVADPPASHSHSRHTHATTSSVPPSSCATPTSFPMPLSSLSPSPSTSLSLTPSLSKSSPAAVAASSDAFSSDYAVNWGGFATYYYQNGVAGACGTVHSDYNFICAMDQALYGYSGNASPLCGQQVLITNTDNGQSVTVTIADDCPTCRNSNSIDLSVAAFQAIADLSTGIVPISWQYLN